MTVPLGRSPAADASCPEGFSVQLPGWVAAVAREHGERLATREDRMRLAIDLSARNIREGSGGPFGAAIVERDSGRLVSVGVNVVVASHCSLAHAETVAIALAQRRLQTYDLGGPGLPAHELVTSAEPCAMCFGAIPWSGVRSLVCGARDEDSRAIGFDEGPRAPDWVTQLAKRNIEVVLDVLRADARQVLREYVLGGGEIYNSREAP